MTNEEAIQRLKEEIGEYTPFADKWNEARLDIKALNMAINALEQEPCEDAISRQALLDDFGLSEKTRKWGGDHSGYNTMMLYEIQDVIESEPSVKTQEPKWIPVSERLPEEDGCYLVTTTGTNNNIIDIAYYTEGIWHKASKIKAWMPLPKPYREEGEEE